MAEDELEEEFDEQEPYRIPLWKKLLLALAVASVLFGLGLQVFGGEAAPGTGTAGTPSAAGGAGFVPATSPGGAPTGTAESGSASEWSPFFVKGGFSFFVGFCIGYALRAFFKISAVALGIVFLAIFGLQQIGIVEVD